MPSTNIFANAKTIAAPAPSAKKAKKVQAHIDGLEMYALLDATEKSIKTLKETYRSVVDPQVTDEFVATGMLIKRQPDNFEGTDGAATASCEIRKRSSASGLDAAELAACKEHGISTERAVSTPEAFIFNPAYMNDSALMERISKAISGIKGIPADLILKQEETFKNVTTEKSIDEVFALGDEKLVRQLLPIVSTPALKPKYSGFDLAEALTTIHDEIVEEEEAAA